MSNDPDLDVLVIGSGAAGLAAALSACEAGATSVLVAESEEVVGGSSRLSGGLMMGAGTRYQRESGVEDDAEALFHEYMLLNHWDVQVGVVKRFAELAGPTVEWVGDRGVEFYDEMVFGGDERVPRVHVPVGRGQAVVDTLKSACLRSGVEFALCRRVDRLLVEDGRVVGAAVGGDEVRARSVVLATGGFGADREKLAEFFPSAAQVPSVWYIGADGARGDALDLGREVGASITGRDRGLRLMHPDFVRVYEAYLPGWLLLVDGNGERFMDETAPYGITDGLLRAHDDQAFVVFDQAIVDQVATEPRARYKQTVPGSTKRQSPNWNADTIAEMVASGRISTAPTIAGLATDLGVDPGRLAGAVERYNDLAAGGQDIDFDKAPEFLQPVALGPFYGAVVRPATVCFTACGLRIDPDARVLGEDGRAIPNLYAAGEAAGGVIGPAYMGSGNSYASCLVFGRVAGATAVADVRAAGRAA